MRKGAVAIGFVAMVTMAAVGGHYFVQQFADLPLPSLPNGLPCDVRVEGDATIPLSSEQMANAATISAVGIRRGIPRRGVVVALATAWQESKIENRPGGDRDSIGLFQQRPSHDWGTPEQISDPRYATNAFYDALLKVPDWQKLRVTEAAQAVQISAYPEAYEQWAARAEHLASALGGDTTGAVTCEVDGDPVTRGAEAVKALAATMRLDWGDIRSTSQESSISITVRNESAGWQYAHWLVAHAEDRGVQRVRYNGQEWTAKSGTWEKSGAEASGTAKQAVLADVAT
jgi:hypothetical protein